MRALVVYESMYGNTRQIAHAVAAGLRTSITADVVPVSEVRDQHVLTSDLIVVGGPTHAWGMSHRRTREASAQPPKKGGPAPTVDAASLPLGIREWLRGVTAPAGSRAAAFDTRLDKPAWLTGSAAKGVARALVAAGFAIFSHAQSFTVSGSNGPLTEGELERARQWGEDMGHRLIDIGAAAPTRAA
jgi:hypothetical protein